MYQVDGAMLSRLDQLEGHPEIYVRTDIDCCLLVTNDTEHPVGDAIKVKCQIYFLTDFKPTLLDLPYINDYRDSVEKPFLPDGTESLFIEEVKLSQT